MHVSLQDEEAILIHGLSNASGGICSLCRQTRGRQCEEGKEEQGTKMQNQFWESHKSAHAKNWIERLRITSGQAAETAARATYVQRDFPSTGDTCPTA